MLRAAIGSIRVSSFNRMVTQSMINIAAKHSYRQTDEVPYSQEWDNAFLTKKGIGFGTVIELSDRSLVKCGISKGLSSSRKSLIVKLTTGKEMLVDARQVIDVWPATFPSMSIEQLKEIEELSWSLLPREPLQAVWRRQMFSRKFDLPSRSTSLAQELFGSQSPQALIATLRILNENDNFYVTRARASFEGYRLLPKTGVDRRVLNRFAHRVQSLKTGKEPPPHTFEEQRIFELLETFHITSLLPYTSPRYLNGFRTVELSLAQLGYPSTPEGATSLLKDIGFWEGAVPPLGEFPPEVQREAELLLQRWLTPGRSQSTPPIGPKRRVLKRLTNYSFIPQTRAHPLNYGVSVDNSHGKRTVLVHIADLPSSLQDPNSALEIEAAKRGCSVTDGVYQRPLYPVMAVQALQLQQHFRNNAITVAMEFNRNGTLECSDIFLSEVPSVYPIAYHVLQQVLFNKSVTPPLGKRVPSDMRLLHSWAEQALRAENKRSAGNIGAILQCVEELAAKCLSDFLNKHGVPFADQFCGLKPLNSYPDLLLQRQIHAVLLQKSLPYSLTEFNAAAQHARSAGATLLSAGGAAPEAMWQRAVNLTTRKQYLTGSSEQLLTCVVHSIEESGSAVVVVPAIPGLQASITAPSSCHRGTVLLAHVRVHDGVLRLLYSHSV